MAREEVKKLKETIKRHQTLQGLRDQLSELGKEFVWAQVFCQEKRIEEYQSKIAEIKENFAKFHEASIENNVNFENNLDFSIDGRFFVEFS